jgi:hypothetical protein
LDLSSETPSSTPAALLPLWRRLLDALWMAAKMGVMFTLVSVLWLILTVPTIDQKLHALFSFLRHHLATSSSKCTQARSRGRKASQLQFDDDEYNCSCCGEHHSSNGEEKARLTGSQELKKSEEGDNKKEEEAAAEAKEEASGAAAGKGEEKPKEEQQQEESEASSAMKSKRKRVVKSVRWSDDASQE